MCKITINQNNKQTITRPENTVFNIQHGCLSTKINNKGPHSISPSLIDDIFTVSEGNYTEYVVALNNIEVDVS